jgi:hypothetical protein
LFTHYFFGHDARPVSRLAISPEELAKVVGAPDTDAAAARDAFLQVVRCSPSVFRRHLSSASLEHAAWNRREPPPFLVYLFFTCFAAASLDADTANVGVFRERLRQLLRHEAGTSYPLGDLSELWEAFAAWLLTRHNEGEPYRTLSLPDRGWMTLIGYSVRLAFPRREDRLRLRDVLAAAGAGTAPTVPEAFQAIDRARSRFSADFRHVFDRARDALERGRDVPELQALWSAVVEAAALAGPPSRQAARLRFQLLAQEDELGYIDPFVVAVGVPPSTPRGLQFTRLDEPFEAFDHFLCAADGSPSSIVRLLLTGALDDMVSGLAGGHVQRAVREGVLLFQRVDSATWQLAVTRPSEGRVRMLIRTRLRAEVLRLLSGSGRRERRSRFDGWDEISEFDITELAEVHGTNTTALKAVRCLQRIEIGPQVHLVGGIRIDGGYLGIPGLLPEMHCAEAEQAALFQLTEGPGEPRSEHVTTLEPDEQRRGSFRWPRAQGALEGAYLLAGVKAGRVVAPREIVFHSRGLSHDYACPTDPARWLVEACISDVTPAGPTSDGFLETAIGVATPVMTTDADSVDGVRVLTNRSIDDESSHDLLVEALAAISVARRGIAESELIEILTKLVPETNGSSVWAIMRGWLEAGYLDCLTRRQWRGRVYFARRPQFVLMQDRDRRAARVVLHGLPPYRLRSVVRASFLRDGATLLPAASLSQFVPAPLSWRFESLEHASAAMSDLAELDVSSVREPTELAGNFDGTVSDTSPLPPGYERQRVWDWAVGGFRRPGAVSSTDDVRIEYFTRTNGPDRYVVAKSARRLVTLSRSWALLDAFRYAGKCAFLPVGSLTIVRQGDDGPHVPLPIARAIGLRAGIAAGPTGATQLGHHYAYATERSSEQRWLLGWLSGAKVDENVVRRFAWLRSAVATRHVDGVTLPPDLRRRLRELHSISDALALVDRRVPRHLLPHVRRAVDLAEA